MCCHRNFLVLLSSRLIASFLRYCSQQLSNFFFMHCSFSHNNCVITFWSRRKHRFEFCGISAFRFDYFSPPSLPPSFSLSSFPHIQSPISLLRFQQISTNFLRSFVLLSNAAVFMLPHVTVRYVRRHVKITFDLLQSRERKGSRRAALNELARDSLRDVFRPESRRTNADVAHRGSTDKTHRAIHHNPTIIWLSVPVRRWIKCRVPRCRCRGVCFCRRGLSAPFARYRTNRTYGAFSRVIWLEIILLR